MSISLPSPPAVDPSSFFSSLEAKAASELGGLGLAWRQWRHESGKPPSVSQDASQRATAAVWAMDAYMGRGGGSYSDVSNHPLMPSSVWPLGQAIAAHLDQAGSNSQAVAKAMGGLSLYGNSHDGYHPGVAGGARYYDDNAWLGLDAIQAYAQTKDPRYLKQAQGIMSFITQGWVNDPGYAHPGGIRWVQGGNTRNTCDNAPAMELALHLYLTTHDVRYLKFAKQVDGWLQANLRGADGLYSDNMSKDGQVQKTLWTYNQGTPIGADVLFYRATGDRSYLTRAKQTADAALAYFGKDNRFWKQPAAFNAIFFRNLQALDAVAPDPRYRQALKAYADRAWSKGRDPRTDLFSMGKPGGVSLLQQAGMTQIFSLLAMKPSRRSQIS